MLKLIKAFVQVFTLLIAGAQVSVAASPVWKISNGDSGETLFLGGTIHVLSQDDYPLPEAFNDAYSQTSVLVLEADLGAFQDPSRLPQLMSSMMYSDGTTLNQVLSPETFGALEDYCQARGLPIELILGLRPGMAMVMVTSVELQRLGLLGTGVDEYYRQRAAGQGRKIDYLESANDQIEFIAGLGAGQEDDFVNYSLAELHRIPELLKQIKSAWREGNLDSLEQISLGSMKSRFPGTYETLVYNRNMAWLPALESMLDTGETELVLVGALHLAGSDGLLSLLRGKGYVVTMQ